MSLSRPAIQLLQTSTAPTTQGRGEETATEKVRTLTESNDVAMLNSWTPQSVALAGDSDAIASPVNVAIPASSDAVSFHIEVKAQTFFDGQ